MLLNILSQLTVYPAVVIGTCLLSLSILYINHEFFDTTPGLNPTENRNSFAFFANKAINLYLDYGSWLAILGCNYNNGPFNITPANLMWGFFIINVTATNAPIECAYKKHGLSFLTCNKTSCKSF